jgi:hypothetical protein
MALAPEQNILVLESADLGSKEFVAPAMTEEDIFNS